MKSNFKKKLIKDFTLLATKKIKITTDVKMVGLNKRFYFASNQEN